MKSDCKKWCHGVSPYYSVTPGQMCSICKEENHFLRASVPNSGLWDSTTSINVLLAASGLQCNTGAIPHTSVYASVIPPGLPLFSVGTYHRKQFCWWCAKWERGASSLSFSGVGSAGLAWAKSSEEWIFTTKVGSCDSEHIKPTACLS